jgi:hypothetical protein
MKWVTRDYVHLDRVASPWLIKRFVDPDAEFVFVPWVHEGPLPDGATPFALAGHALGPHDAAGSTFKKIVVSYEIGDPAVARLAKVIQAGIDHFLHGFNPAPDDTNGQIGVALLTIADGMALVHQNDGAILEASFVLYDALYAQFRVEALIEAQGLEMPQPNAKLGPAPHFEFLRGVYNRG